MFSLPTCQSAQHLWASLGLLYDQSSPGVRLLNKIIFTGWGCLPHGQLPSWRTRVSVLVWTLPFDLTGMGGPAGS
jgi:hypothetical protein